MDISRLKVGGAVVFWRLAKSTNLPTVAKGLRDMGLEDYIPEPRSPMSCLRAVLDDIYVPPDKEQRYVVRPHKNCHPGFAVVSERPKDHAQAGDDWGKVVATAHLSEAGELSLDPWDGDRERAIRAGMAGAAEWLTVTSVGKALVSLVEHFGGVALRPAGGVYWLNDAQLDDWAKVSDVFEAASTHSEQDPSKVYVLRVVADEQMIRAVGDALTVEVEKEVAEIEAEVSRAGDEQLSEKACLRRMERADKIEAKVRRYEAAFGTPLTKLTEATKRAAGAAAWAVLQHSVAASPAPVTISN
jgi:hypothetical protein